MLLVALVLPLMLVGQEKITVIGLGRLGLCMALAFERAGLAVMGVDLSQSYIDTLNNKKFVSNEPFVEEYLTKSNSFYATTSLEEGLNFSDIYFVVVDTPSSLGEAYDHSKLSRLFSKINKQQVRNKHVVICCTIFPDILEM